MDQLERLIIESRDEIQNDLPHEGHFERFEMKLSAKKERKIVKLLAYAASVAAIAVIFFSVLTPERTSGNEFTLSDISAQYADVENYYTNTIDKQTQKVETLVQQETNRHEMQELLDELKESDKTYEQLCADLKATPNDQRVINALIIYYQNKLEIINKILGELENQETVIENTDTKPQGLSQPSV